MEIRQKKVLQALRRVQDFLDEHAPGKQPANYVVQRKVLDDLVTRLETHAVKQDLGGRRSTGDTKRQRALRRVLLRKQMRPIARIARALNVPGVEKDLKMPALRIDSEGLVTAAHAMKEAAAPHKQVFVDNGRSEDFIEQLGAAADAVKASIDGRSANRSTQIGATAGMKGELTEARQALKLLNAIVLPEIEDSQELVAKWRAAKRISRSGIGSATAPESAVPKAAA